MKFHEALFHARLGVKIRRKDWPDHWSVHDGRESHSMTYFDIVECDDWEIVSVKKEISRSELEEIFDKMYTNRNFFSIRNFFEELCKELGL